MEVQKMIDSGILKAILDIFQDYLLAICQNKTTLTNEDQVQDVVA